MHMRSTAVAIGLGAALGAVAVLMMPNNNPTRQFAQKAADKMEDAAMRMGDKLSQEMDL